MGAQLDFCWAAHGVDELGLFNEGFREIALDEIDAHVVVFVLVVQLDDGVVHLELHVHAGLRVSSEPEPDVVGLVAAAVPAGS